MRNDRDLYELRLHELQFMLKKLKIHEKIYGIAASEFSSVFKEHVESIEDGKVKHKIKKIAGLVGESEKRTTSTAKRAKQEGARRRERKNPTKKEIQKEQFPPPKPTSSADKSIPKEYKSLYRKVVGATHPDKTGGDEDKKKILQDVNNAVLNKEYFKIVESALLLGLDLPDDVPLSTKEIDNKISSVKQKIKGLTKSVAWEWYHIDEEEVKTVLIDRYIHFLLNR